MSRRRWNSRVLDSTRGRILSLLRRVPCTVGDLAGELGLTPNGVRGHLTSLERDGLVEQTGLRPGLRKPNYVYALTSEAEHLFPKAYDLVLNTFLTLLGERLAPEAMGAILRDLGHRLAEPFLGEAAGLDVKGRLEFALRVLAGLGGLAEAEEENGAIRIRGCSCPLGTVAAEHAQMCQVAEALLSDLIGVPVHERCHKGEKPRCLFELDLDDHARTLSS